MKITKYKEEGDMIRITTQSDGEFVYFKDKFKDLASLEKEINKKITETNSKKEKKESKFKKLKEELDEKVK